MKLGIIQEVLLQVWSNNLEPTLEGHLFVFEGCGLYLIPFLSIQRELRAAYFWPMLSEFRHLDFRV